MRLNNLFIPFLFLVSCSYEVTSISICDYENNIITKDELFSFGNEYLVFVYLDKCMACRDLKLRLMNYCKTSALPIYYLNFEDTDFFLHDKNESNIGISDYNDIYIKSVPHLLKISNFAIEEEWNGFDTISNYLFF